MAATTKHSKFFLASRPWPPTTLTSRPNMMKSNTALHTNARTRCHGETSYATKQTTRRLSVDSSWEQAHKLSNSSKARHFSPFQSVMLSTNISLPPGINIMSYYLPTVLITSVGLTNSTARLLTACNATSYFIFSCIAVTMIERFGRRGLMLLSGSGQFVFFLVITILLRFAETDTDTDKAYGSASVAFFFLYHVALGVGMLGVPWLYPTEINSLPMRTKGAAVATATNWYVVHTSPNYPAVGKETYHSDMRRITNFAIVEITPIGIQNIGWRFWIVWTVLNAVFLPVIYFLYPETGSCFQNSHTRPRTTASVHIWLDILGVVAQY